MNRDNERRTGWERDFVDFLSTEDLPPPAAVTKKVVNRTSSFLHPSPWQVFNKLAIIVLGVSLMNLAICPQFGLSYFRNPGLVQYFMMLGLGHLGCNVICGCFFIATALLVAVIILRPEELRVLRKTKFLQITAVSALTLSAFVALGADVFLPIGTAWLIGAIVGGVLTIEAGYWIRFALYETTFSSPA